MSSARARAAQRRGTGDARGTVRRDRWQPWVAVALTLVLLAGCEGGAGHESDGEVAAGRSAAPPGEAPAQSLLAWADATPDEGAAPLAVAFKATVHGPAGPLRLRWSFGDGSADSTEREPKHTYPSPGDYRVRLEATGPGGESDSDEIHVVVR